MAIASRLRKFPQAGRLIPRRLLPTNRVAFVGAPFRIERSIVAWSQSLESHSSPSNVKEPTMESEKMPNQSEIAGRRFTSLGKFAQRRGVSLEKLPFSFKVLLENLLRHEHSEAVTDAQIDAVAGFTGDVKAAPEIAFHPRALSCKTLRVYLPSSTLPPCVTHSSAWEAIPS